MNLKPNSLGLLTPEQVAQLLGISTDHLNRKVKDKIGYIRITRRVVRYTEEQVKLGLELLKVKPEV